MDYYSRLDVLILAGKAVKLPAKFGHGDVGDTLVSMLKDEISSNEAHDRIELLMQDYRK